MTSQDYQALSRRLYNNFPLIGWLLRRWTAKRLAKDGSGEAIAILAEAIKRSWDQAVKDIAFPVLKQLKSQDSINIFCQVWAESRHRELTTILKNRRYVSTEPKFLVLSALKVGELDLVKKGDVNILDPLLAAISDKDTQIASAASVCIIELKDRRTVDILCERWIENPSSQLQNVIHKGKYEPEETISKALFYFLLGEWQKYEDLDLDQSLLTKAYKLANKQVKERVSKQAGTAGRVEFIKVLTSGKHNFDVEQMTDQEWESLSDILGVQPDRKTIWKFLYNAPAIWSKKLLDKLTKSSCNWFRQDEEDMVKTLLTLSENSKEEDFRLIPYLLMQDPEHITSLIPELGKSKKEWQEHESNWHQDNANWCERADFSYVRDAEFYKWKLYFSPDSQILFGVNCSTKDLCSKGIRLWSLPDGKLLNILENTNDLTLVVSPDNKIVVSTGGENESNEINLWSLPSGNRMRSLKVKMSHYIKPNAKGLISLAITPDGKMLVSRCWSIDPKWYPDNIRKPNESWSTYDKRQYHEKTELTKRILKENTINLWSLPSGDYIRSIPSPIIFESQYPSPRLSNEGYMVVSPDSRFLVSGSGDGNLGFWDLSNDNYTQLNEPTTNHTFREDYKALGRNNTIISHDGRILVSATKHGIDLQSLPDGSFLRTLTLSNDNSDQYNGRIVESVTWVQISNDNRILIALIKSKFRSIYSNTLDMWDLYSGSFLKSIRSLEDAKIQISPDSNALVIANRSGISLYSLNHRNTNIPISKFTSQDITEISSKVKDSTIQESFRNALKFTLALINLKQKFDIDIEDSSNDIASSEFDIEIEE